MRNYFRFDTNSDSGNWLYDKHLKRQWYPKNINFRYWTFQIAFNILEQTCQNPIIIETGCQKQEEDIGDGLSTSVLGEFVCRNNGKLITVDISEHNINQAKKFTREYSNNIEYVVSDSISFLRNYDGKCDLLYLDSLDYSLDPLMKTERKKAQEHCFNEFLAIRKNLKKGSLLLVDDNGLGGGGKPRILKEYIHNMNEEHWLCLFDYRQALWVKEQ
jgi:hypothetical protein